MDLLLIMIVKPWSKKLAYNIIQLFSKKSKVRD